MNNLFELRKDIPKKTYIMIGTGTFLVLLIVWSILSYGGFVPPLFLPTPTKVLGDLFSIYREGRLWKDIVYSNLRVIGGFSLSVIFAVPLGILMGSFKSIEALFNPFTALMRYVPATAFVGLLIIWAGIGEEQKILLLFIGIFFYLLSLITESVSNVQKELLETSYTLGAKKMQVLTKVILPASLPSIFDHCRVMMGVGWTYVVVAEMVAADFGLGNLIYKAGRFNRTGEVFAGLLIIGLLGVMWDYLFKFAYSKLFFWKEENQ